MSVRWGKWRENHSALPRPRLRIDQSVAGQDAPAIALERIREYCETSGEVQLRSARKWKARARYLGIPATILAAASGATGLASDQFQTPVALGALAAAVLGGLVTSLNPAQKSEDRSLAARRLEKLARDIGVLLYVDRSAMTSERLRSALEDSLGRVDEIQELPKAPSFRFLPATRQLDEQ